MSKSWSGWSSSSEWQGSGVGWSSGSPGPPPGLCDVQVLDLDSASCHVSSRLTFNIGALHIGHSFSCDVHTEQNPLEIERYHNINRRCACRCLMMVILRFFSIRQKEILGTLSGVISFCQIVSKPMLIKFMYLLRFLY